MWPRAFVRACIAVLLSCAAAPATLAQSAWHAGVGAAYVFPAAGGRVDECHAPHRTPLALQVGGQAAGQWLAIELHARLGAFAWSGGQCHDRKTSVGRWNGTYLFEDRPRALLSSRWVSTDLRLRATLPIPGSAPTLSLGHGRHWQSGGGDERGGWRAFWVGTAGFLFGLDPRWQVLVEAELHLLRETFESRRVIWADGVALSEDHLGSTTEWSRAAAVTMSVVWRW